jgi:hypothetical protein
MMVSGSGISPSQKKSNYFENGLLLCMFSIKQFFEDETRNAMLFSVENTIALFAMSRRY